MRFSKLLEGKLRTLARLNARVLMVKTLLDIAKILIDEIPKIHEDDYLARQSIHRMIELLDNVSNGVVSRLVNEAMAIDAYCGAACLFHVKDDIDCEYRCLSECYAVYKEMLLNEASVVRKFIASSLSKGMGLVYKHLNEVEKRYNELVSKTRIEVEGVDKEVVKKILNLITELYIEDGCVKLEALVSKASEMGIDRDTVDKVIKLLLGTARCSRSAHLVTCLWCRWCRCLARRLQSS